MVPEHLNLFQIPSVQTINNILYIYLGIQKPDRVLNIANWKFFRNISIVGHIYKKIKPSIKGFKYVVWYYVHVLRLYSYADHNSSSAYINNNNV